MTTRISLPQSTRNLGEIVVATATNISSRSGKAYSAVIISNIAWSAVSDVSEELTATALRVSFQTLKRDNNYDLSQIHLLYSALRSGSTLLFIVLRSRCVNLDQACTKQSFVAKWFDLIA
jgi:hypothetical protein